MFEQYVQTTGDAESRKFQLDAFLNTDGAGFESTLFMKTRAVQPDKPAVLRLSSDPLAVMELEKIRISLTRQISHYGWRRIALGLQAACEHGAAHQRQNPGAAALWRWRGQMMRQLAGRQTVPGAEPPSQPGRQSPIANRASQIA